MEIENSSKNKMVIQAALHLKSAIFYLDAADLNIAAAYADMALQGCRALQFQPSEERRWV